MRGFIRRLLGDAPAPADKDASDCAELKRKLAGIPRYTPGRVSVAGWDLEYVDAPAFISCFEVIVVKRWNDFAAERPDPLILDCGANIGVSVLHYKRLCPRARITAFEPDREICRVLRRNLQANNASDVAVIEAAVSSRAGEQLFFAEGADGSRLINPADARPGSYPVKTVRLADYLKGEPVDFLKLDIEGAEAEVVPDCAALLHNVRCMNLEFHHLVDKTQAALAATLAALAGAGFSVSLNSYGAWVDLNRPPVREGRNPLESDQYFLICAWRDGGNPSKGQ